MRSVLMQLVVLALINAPVAPARGEGAHPLLASVAIDVRRDSDVRFNGHRLPRAAEGMGVATRADEIATAAHVVWGADDILITDAHGARRGASIEYIDPRADVALLRVEQPLGHFATIRMRAVERGERVGAVAHQSMQVTIIAAGTILATHWRSHGVAVPLILTGIKGRKGMSGGGLYDETGRLLGIIVRIDRRLGYLSALPVGELCSRFSRCTQPRSLR